ncbi:MAG: sulfite exporter TauE/SafE family protein [Clostridiaceae bacterium]|nr:sulfite exporter TauE/SafE family protein [Clostridiaceae bacterium]
MSIITIILFGLTVLITHFLEGITGFGCTVLAMPFCIMLVGIKVSKPILAICSLLLSIFIIINSYKHILWNHYIKILCYVSLGLPLGFWAFDKLPESTLKRILALFMIAVAIRGLLLSYGKYKATKPINNHVLSFILFLGGCIHGAFASGGPLVILYASEKIKNKTNFRATLCLLWITLNTIVILQSFIKGSLTSDTLRLLLFILPFLFIGAVLGNWAHYRIKDSIFSKMVYIVLFISAVFTFF